MNSCDFGQFNISFTYADVIASLSMYLVSRVLLFLLYVQVSIECLPITIIL